MKRKKRSKIFKLKNRRDGSVDKVFAPREDISPGLTWKGDVAVCTGEEETEDPGSSWPASLA